MAALTVQAQGEYRRVLADPEFIRRVRRAPGGKSLHLLVDGQVGRGAQGARVHGANLQRTTLTMGWAESARYRSSSCARLAGGCDGERHTQVIAGPAFTQFQTGFVELRVEIARDGHQGGHKTVNLCAHDLDREKGRVFDQRILAGSDSVGSSSALEGSVDMVMVALN